MGDGGHDYFMTLNFTVRTTIWHPVKESTRGGIHMCVWLPVNTCGSEAGHNFIYKSPNAIYR